MKRFLFLSVITLCVAGCSSDNAGNVKGRSFAEQYAALEKEPVQATQPAEGALTFQTPEERARQVEIDSQRERRAQPPLVESDYIFRVKPEKSVYSYDEHNEVWTDDPKAKDYKETKRLWTKPKRYEGDYVPSDGGGSGSSDAGGGGSDATYEEWGEAY
jgi:hypothetical protein